MTPAVASELAHLGGVVGVATERLVAQHRVTGGDRLTHMVEMQERRGMDRDQVDVVPATEGGRRRLVPRGHHVDHFTPVGRREHRSHDPRAETEPDHPHPDGLPASHQPLVSCGEPYRSRTERALLASTGRGYAADAVGEPGGDVVGRRGEFGVAVGRARV